MDKQAKEPPRDIDSQAIAKPKKPAKPPKPPITRERAEEIAQCMMLAQIAMSSVTTEELDYCLKQSTDMASRYQALGCLLDPSGYSVKSARHRMIIDKAQAFLDLRKAMAQGPAIEDLARQEEATKDLVANLFGGL